MILLSSKYNWCGPTLQVTVYELSCERGDLAEDQCVFQCTEWLPGKLVPELDDRYLEC